MELSLYLLRTTGKNVQFSRQPGVKIDALQLILASKLALDKLPVVALHTIAAGNKVVKYWNVPCVSESILNGHDLTMKMSCGLLDDNYDDGDDVVNDDEDHDHDHADDDDLDDDVHDDDDDDDDNDDDDDVCRMIKAKWPKGGKKPLKKRSLLAPL